MKIVGVLKTLGDGMNKNLEAMSSAEEPAVISGTLNIGYSSISAVEGSFQL